MLRRNIAMTLNRKKKGQSTIEYVLLVTGVVGALIIFLRPNGPFSQGLGNTYGLATNGMINMAGRLDMAHPFQSN